MITVRLDPKLEEAVNNAAKYLDLTKSELIRRSINEYINNMKQPSAWESGKDLFGKYSSDLGDLSEKRKIFIKNKIRAKR